MEYLEYWNILLFSSCFNSLYIIIMFFDFVHACETVIAPFQLRKALSAFVLIITFWSLLLFCSNFEVWDKFWDKSFPIPPLHFLTEEGAGLSRAREKVLIEKRLTSVRAKEIYKGGAPGKTLEHFWQSPIFWTPPTYPASACKRDIERSASKKNGIFWPNPKIP